jgi:hypothetical protein
MEAMKRVLIVIAVAGTAALLLVPASQARPGTSSYDPWTQNVIAQQRVPYDPWFTNLATRQQAGLQSTASSLPDAGTNWSMIGGVLGGAALVMLLSAGVAVTVRRSRHPVHA